jgi:hypothetical protein
MLGISGVVEVIEATALQRRTGHREAGWVDDVQRNPKAGAESQHGAGILGDIGLIEGQFERDLSVPAESVAKSAGV